MTDLVPVRVPCPSGQHPDGDSVSLKPKLDFPGGFEARKKINELTDGATSDEVIGLLMDVYVRHGIASWTLHDDEGKDVPLNRQTIRERILADLDIALTVANKADELYYESVVAPLVAAASKSSQATPPEPSTSAPKDSQESPRKPSKRSSTSTSQTDATTPTSA